MKPTSLASGNAAFRASKFPQLRASVVSAAAGYGEQVANFTQRERVVVVSFSVAVAVGGAIFGYVAGGLGEALFISIIAGTSAFIGAYLPATSMARARNR